MSDLKRYEFHCDAIERGVHRSENDEVHAVEDIDGRCVLHADAMAAIEATEREVVEQIATWAGGQGFPSIARSIRSGAWKVKP
jgi:hypothetical protein